MMMFQKWAGAILYQVHYNNGTCEVVSLLGDNAEHEFSGNFNDCVKFIDEMLTSYAESMF